MYGDDAGLWEEDLFHRFLLFDTTPDNLGARMNTLFQVLNTPENRREARIPKEIKHFPYVNGSLFAEHMPQEFFDEEMREALLAASRFHWTRISPAIFGSMFQLVKSKEARRGDGEHYTSEKNILKVLEPLFLDELRDKAARLIRNKSTSVPDLRRFRDSLAEHVFLDPACGAGNFLVVAYRELRKIETDIIVEIREREGQSGMALDATWEQKLSINQFYGFELNWWPAKIAETAMFLVDHQANRRLARRIGAAPDRLPITITAHIRHGNALRMAWDTELPRTNGTTYVFGNPPFVGHQRKTKEQREDLKRVWGDNPSGVLDYVTCWHAKAKDLLASRVGEFAYVTTNSIAQGQSVPALFGPLFSEGWRIKFAHRTFAWDSEAPGKAAVHCVIIGFCKGSLKSPQLWDYHDLHGDPKSQTVNTAINGYLIDGPLALIETRRKVLSPQLPKASFGTMPIDGGNLIVESDEYEDVIADPIAAKYVRPFRGSKELVDGLSRWCLWMGDDDFNPRDISASTVLRNRVAACQAFRENSVPTGDAYKYRETPYLMRPNANRPIVPYVCIPSVVSESRRYMTAQHYGPDVIASNLVFTAVDPDGLLFGLISSSMFMAWQKAVGGRLKSDIRFANTLT